MKNTQWKSFDKLANKCYNNMIGAEKDDTCWAKAFDLLMEIVREERKVNPAFAPELDLVDDETDYVHDVTGWLEDCLDEMDMRKQYELFLQMCEDLLKMFSWPEYSGSDLKFRKSNVLQELGRNEQSVRYCCQWLQEEPENIMAATAYVYALLEEKSYEKAMKVIQEFVTDEEECTEENEIMFRAMIGYYKAIGDKKKQKKLEKILKEYEDYVDQCISQWCEGEDEDEWDLEDELPFN